MAKKGKKVKPHLADSGMKAAMRSTFGLEQELERHRRNPTSDGIHVVEMDGGYEVYFSERGVNNMGRGRFFKSKAEADEYLKSSPEVYPNWL